VYVWRIVASSITLLIIGFGLGCEGFFVDPVLTGITVGPAATIQTGETLQMSAVGTYDDGKQKSFTSGVVRPPASPRLVKADW
jgi:hypothetical protein